MRNVVSPSKKEISFCHVPHGKNLPLPVLQSGITLLLKVLQSSEWFCMTVATTLKCYQTEAKEEIRRSKLVSLGSTEACVISSVFLFL